MKTEHLHKIIRELITLSHETEWVEFKHNYADAQDIGEYLSALANGVPCTADHTAISSGE